jgi:hypothetical protein
VVSPNYLTHIIGQSSPSFCDVCHRTVLSPILDTRKCWQIMSQIATASGPHWRRRRNRKLPDRSVEQIDKLVQVSENQREALDELHQALSQAANDLEAHCSTPVPQSAVGRLDALEDRLDATWRGILSIQVALYHFETELSVDQKNRFKTMTFAAQD